MKIDKTPLPTAYNFSTPIQNRTPDNIIVRILDYLTGTAVVTLDPVHASPAIKTIVSDYYSHSWLCGKPVGGSAVDVAVKPPFNLEVASVGGVSGPEDEAD